MPHILKRPALLALPCLALSLAACASSGAGEGAYSSRLDMLGTDCEARGGILTPIVGSAHGTPERDYACEIRGPSTR